MSRTATVDTQAFSNTDSTQMHLLPPEKKGNLLGNAIVWASEKGQDASTAAGIIPFGIGTAIETLGLTATTATEMGGHAINGDGRKIVKTVLKGGAEVGIGVSKVFTHGTASVVDFGYGIATGKSLTRKGGEMFANMVLPDKPANIESSSGMPTSPPLKTPKVAQELPRRTPTPV